jgi:hypothetical protein
LLGRTSAVPMLSGFAALCNADRVGTADHAQ